jgi:hypothetical protein
VVIDMPNRATPPPVVEDRVSGASASVAHGEGDTAAGLTDLSGPRIPKRIEWLDLPAPYEALRLRVWTNFPHRVLQALDAPKTTAELEASLRAVVLEHNGWVGDDGEPLPDAQSDGFWWCPASW